MTKALIELKPGERGRVVRIRGRGNFHRRLASVGLTVGRILEMNAVQSRDCVEVRVKEDNLRLLREEASRIYVEMM